MNLSFRASEETEVIRVRKLQKISVIFGMRFSLDDASSLAIRLRPFAFLCAKMKFFAPIRELQVQCRFVGPFLRKTYFQNYNENSVEMRVT